MTKYLLKRLLTGVLSACAATIIVMIMIFSLLDRNLILQRTPCTVIRQIMLEKPISTANGENTAILIMLPMLTM